MQLRGLYFRVLAPSIWVACLALLTAKTVLAFTPLRLGTVVQDYLIASISATLCAGLIWMLLTLIRCDRRALTRPNPRILKRLSFRWPLILLPAILSPLFLAAYTTAKSGIPFLVGFHWDAALAALDHSIFHADPWQITHNIIGTGATGALAIGYGLVWLAALVFVQAFLALYGRARLVGIFFSTMMATWLVGGVGFAYLFASAGPALVHAVNPSLANRFAELVSALSLSPVTSDISLTQNYLIGHLHEALVIKGGGVSAMPSMHIATVVIYVLAARGTRWFWPAIAFAALIWIGSVHFGYHYAVDGPAAAVIACSCWSAMARLQDVLERFAKLQTKTAVMTVL